MLISRSTEYSQLKGGHWGRTETHADDEMKFLSRQIQLLLVGYAEDSFGLPQQRSSSSLVRYIVRWFLMNLSFSFSIQSFGFFGDGKAISGRIYCKIGSHD